MQLTLSGALIWDEEPRRRAEASVRGEGSKGARAVAPETESN